MTINYDLKEQKRVACLSNDFARGSWNFSGREFKIFMNAVSLINPESTEMPDNEFTALELAILTDTTKNKTGISQIKQILSSLVKKTIKFDRNGNDEFNIVSSYKGANTSTVRVKINDDLKEHFLLVDCVEKESENGDIEKSKVIKKYYVKIDMEIFNTLKSPNSMRLYILLKSYQKKRKTDNISSQDIRFMLGFDTNMDVKVFNRDVLAKAIKEINEKTDISVVVNKLTKNKVITGYNFTINSLSKVSAGECEDNTKEFENVEKNKSDYKVDGDSIEGVDNKNTSVNNTIPVMSEKDVNTFVSIAKIGLGMKEREIVQALIESNYDEKIAYKKLLASISA